MAPTTQRPSAVRAAGQRVRRVRRVRGRGLMRCKNNYQTKTVDISLSDVKQGRRLASGKFGEVYLGELASGERVVLKKMRKNVRGSGDFFDSEALINKKLKKLNCSAVPPFLGVAGADVFLVWAYEGTSTLETFLENPRTLGELGKKINVNGTREQICGRTMKNLLQAISALHKSGVVHRDIKPANILVADASSTSRGIFPFGGGSAQLKLIDLGGAADLRTGTNYSDSETVFDPVFGPPEKYIEGNFGGLFSGVSWMSKKPDLFDSYSAGITMLMLCVPQLSKVNAVKSIRKTLDGYRCKGSIAAWRDQLTEVRLIRAFDDHQKHARITGTGG